MTYYNIHVLLEFQSVILLGIDVNDPGKSSFYELTPSSGSGTNLIGAN